MWRVARLQIEEGMVPARPRCVRLLWRRRGSEDEPHTQKHSRRREGGARGVLHLRYIVVVVAGDARPVALGLLCVVDEEVPGRRSQDSSVKVDEDAALGGRGGICREEGEGEDEGESEHGRLLCGGAGDVCSEPCPAEPLLCCAHALE